MAIEVESNQSESLLKRSARGEFDLAFFKQESGARHGTVALSEQLVWVSGPNRSPSPGRSIPLVLFPEGCAYRRLGVGALRSRGLAWHVSFVSPSFECLRTAVVEGLGLTVLARGLVAPPLQVVAHRHGLPALPAVELVYRPGRMGKARVVTEMANYLADCLTKAGSTAGRVSRAGATSGATPAPRLRSRLRLAR